MNLLLIHQNFPGQFRQLIPKWLENKNWNILGIGRKNAPGLPDVKLIKYETHRTVDKSNRHPYLIQMEESVLNGQAVARVLVQLKEKGYQPDVIFAHPGWGETLYAKLIFPDARLIHFSEWYYGTQGSDIGFDPEFESNMDSMARLTTWNALHSQNLINCDVAVAPTAWQKSRHPQDLAHKITEVHEGINVDKIDAVTPQNLVLPNGLTLMTGQPILTYVSRNLEPYRGFHIFMRALQKIQKIHPTVQTVIVGGDDVSYGSKPKADENWRLHMLKEVDLDLERVHFLGKVPYDQYVQLLKISSAHVYLTYPFVLSWSMLESMAAGCVLIASKTAPVMEVIKDGVNGHLVDFFDVNQIAKQVVHVLEHPQAQGRIRQAARDYVQKNYSLAQGESKYTKLINEQFDIKKIKLSKK